MRSAGLGVIVKVANGSSFKIGDHVSAAVGSQPFLKHLSGSKVFHRMDGVRCHEGKARHKTGVRTLFAILTRQ
jgi:hypothetical protein